MYSTVAQPADFINQGLAWWYVGQSWFRNSAQDARWSFCLTAGTLWPANQEQP